MDRLVFAGLALCAQSAWGQAVGPALFEGRGPKESAERAAAAQPPSLGLSLPAPAEVRLPALGPDDLDRLQPQGGLTPVGVHRQLPEGAAALSFADGAAKTTVAGAWQATVAGRLWRLRVTSPGARALRIHFQDFDAGAGNVWVHGADGQVDGPYSGRGMYGDGDFWSDIVFGGSATIEYLPDPTAADREAAPFRIAAVSHIWGGTEFMGDANLAEPPAKRAADAQKAAKPRTGLVGVAAQEAIKQRAAPADVAGQKQTEKQWNVKSAASAARNLSGGPPFPPKNTGGPLTPGVPAAFSLGPIDSPTLFHGDFSFRLQVPANASRVTFTLTSFGFADVDMFVRFGADNEIRAGEVVSDYSSESLLGNEEIVITRSSSPPLRAGAYYISLALFDTGVTASGTLTAQVETEQPSRAGGLLTPGRPSGFRIGPVDGPTLFHGDFSFRLQVPDNAARVTFTLNADRFADVDLYVRFGEDNEIQAGDAVSDYSSTGASGNEEIVITRASSPPLRGGTYYISLGLWDTGVVAEGTLTAQVETVRDCHLDAACYPEWSETASSAAMIAFEKDGSTYACSGTLLNNQREDFAPYFLTAAHCVNTQETARNVIVFWLYQTQACNGEPPDVRSVPRTTGARLLATLGGGIVDERRVHPDGDMTLLHLEGDPPDGVWFSGWDASLQPFDLQVAGIHHPGNEDFGAFKRIFFGRTVRVAAGSGGTSEDVHTVVSRTQGFTEGGSSGSGLFTASEKSLVGVLSAGEQSDENACPIGLLDIYTSLSAFYPHIRQFLDGAPSDSGPRISSGGVVTATGAPPVRRISPNALISVFGQEFAPQGTQALNAALDSAGRIAANLADTCLEIGDRRTPLFTVTPSQINAQAPRDLLPGQVQAAVIRGCGTGSEQRGPAETVAVAAVSPAFFNFPVDAEGRNPVVALHGGGPGLVGPPGLIPGVPFTPAAPGEIVTLYGTGFGATDPPLATGQIPGGAAGLANEVSFTFGGIAVSSWDVHYAGAAPCCAGLYQFTVRLPLVLPDGNAAVSATVRGVSTPRGPFLAVRRQQ